MARSKNMKTTGTITIEIEVSVSGKWCRAEPDVGINEGFFEDAGIEHQKIDWNRIDIEYDEAIQEALSEEAAGAEQDRGDYLRDEQRDREGEE